MADVGSVSVGVVVHGDGLGEKLAATIRAAVLPVIRQLNRELATTKRISSSIDGSGFDKLTASARMAAIATRDVADAHREIARESRYSHLQQIADYDRVAVAAERSAQRQIDAAMAVAAANTAAVMAPGPGSGAHDGGHPSPPTGGGGGGGRADGGRRQGGFLGAILSPIGTNALATLSTGINPAILGVTELTRSLVDLSGAGLALPGVFAGIVTSVGTVALSFQGVGAAVKDMMKALATGDPKALEKATKSLELLAPNAKDAITVLATFGNEFKTLQKDLQNNVFDGLGASLKGFFDSAMPTFRKGTMDISNAWNATFKELLRVGGSSSTKGFFDQIFGNTANAQRQLNKAIEPLIHGLGQLTATGTSFLPRLADGITAVATRFDNFITKAAADGRLDKWISNGFTAFADLGNSIINIGKIITDITGSLGDGKTFLGWLKDATGNLEKFLSSAEGQKKLSEFFNDARETWKELKPLLADAVKLVGDVVHGFQQWGEITMPILRPIFDTLAAFPGLISGVVTAFLGFRTLKGIGDLLGIGKAKTDLASLPGAATTAAGGIKSAFASVLGGIGVGITAQQIGGDLLRPADGSDPSTLGALGGLATNVGGMALAGGMIAGPGGAVAGGVIGALFSLFEVAKRDLDQAKVEFEKYRLSKDTPEAAQAQADYNRITGRDVIEQPSLLTPSGPGYARDLITSGQIQGYTIRPDGSVIETATGTVLPGLNLGPGAGTPYIPSSKYPTGVGPVYGPPASSLPIPMPPVVNPVLPVTPPIAPITSATDLFGGGPGGSGPDLTAIAEQIRNLPTGKVDIQGNIPDVKESLKTIAGDITSLPEGQIKITDPSPELKKSLGEVNAQITDIGNNEITVKANTSQVQIELDRLVREYQSKVIQVNLAPVIGPTPPFRTPTGGAAGGRAQGGVLPGWSPGADNMLVPLSGGEGILIPEAVRGLGGAKAVYALNSMFRGNLSRQGYASGGVFGFDNGGIYNWTGPGSGSDKPWDPTRPLDELFRLAIENRNWRNNWVANMADFFNMKNDGSMRYGTGGFDSGGVFDLEEWIKRQKAAGVGTMSWAELQAAAAGASGKAPSIGVPGTDPLLPNTSTTTSLGLGSTAYVNAGAAAQRRQSLLDFGSGLQASAESNVMGTLQAVMDPIGTAKAMAPLVGLGGPNAPGIRESWQAVGKAITHWDEWQNNGAGALGASLFDMGAMFVPGPKGLGLTDNIATVTRRSTTYGDAIDAISRHFGVAPSEADAMLFEAGNFKPSTIGKRNTGFGHVPPQVVGQPLWGQGLEESLKLGDAMMPFPDPLEAYGQKTWNRLWSAPNTFELYKNAFRDGAQQGFRGEFDWESLGSDPVRKITRDLEQLMDATDPNNQWGMLPDDSDVQAAARRVGAYQALLMNNYELPTEGSMFRGVTLDPSISQGYTVGDVISMPLSSVGGGSAMDGSAAYAERLAKAFSGVQTDAMAQLRGSWMSPSEIADVNARVLQEGQTPVIYEIAAGAKALQGTGEMVTSGQMLIEQIIPAMGDSPMKVILRQLHPGYAAGGMLPGYSPGKDNMLVPLSGGEGIIIPEAMKALGPDWLYQLNSKFRGGLSRTGYAGGGIVGFENGGINPGSLGTPDDTSVLGVLIQIRDLLAGQGGNANPLNQTAAATAAMSDSLTATGATTGGIGAGTWADGTPRNPGYEMAAAAISALGGDPQKFLGPNPALAPMGLAGGGSLYGGGSVIGAMGGTPNLNVDALKRFAVSGNTADLAGTGLDPADPIVAAINTARNKKKGGLSGDTIAGLLDQVVGGTGYDGVMDASNSTLIATMQRYKEKMLKQARGSAGTTAGAGTAGMASGLGLRGIPGGIPSSLLSAPGLASEQGLKPNAVALNRVITSLFPEVTQIGGVRQDPLPDHPSGSALDIMIGSDQALGDRINAFIRNNASALGIDSTIWRDNWADFNGNSSTVAGHQDHIHARVSDTPGMGGLTAADMSGYGGSNPLGYSGGPVPVYLVNPPNGMGGLSGMGQIANILGGPVSAVGTEALNAVTGVGNRPTPETVASVEKLLAENNPMAAAALLGIKVGDYGRAGGAGDPLMTNEQKITPDGSLLSDTGALTDRTVTDSQAVKDAREQQMLDLTSQVRDQLSAQTLTPIMTDGVANGMSSIDPVSIQALGAAIGQAAAGPIADAIRSVMPPPSAAAPTAPSLIPGLATGGPIIGPGTGTSDSVMAMLSNGEYVLSASDVRRAGGFSGVERLRKSLPHFAVGGGVNVNSTVGADFFGVSQVPILGAIVNLLVQVLLKMIGVQIEARDTMTQLSSDMRSFRGEFQKFDATGRLMNDTSALVDRTSSSEKAAADERIRILKIVIEALVQFIVDKIVIPIGQAVANAAIQAGASAAGAAINSQAPGAGGLVSSLISSAGQAGVQIGADLFSTFVAAATPVIADTVGQALTTFFPNITNAVFGGGILAKLFDPITAGIAGITGMFTSLLGAVFGGLSFDEGGVANGIGVMPKATIAPERVLSPNQTALFERMVSALERNGPGGDTHIHAPFTVSGSAEGGRQAHDRLLALLGG